MVAEEANSNAVFASKKKAAIRNIFKGEITHEYL